MNNRNCITLLEEIVPAVALGIRIAERADGCIMLTAPLSLNLNDKGSAFAGSIDSLLDLAGWSAIMLALQNTGIDADVMIVKSETEYTAAVRADMTATAGLAREDTARLLDELKDVGRGRIAVSARLTAAESVCATMSAQYAVRVR